MLEWMRHVFHEALATFSGNMRMRQASQCFLESWLHFVNSISCLPNCLLALFDSKQEVLVWGNKIKHQPEVFLDAVQPSRNPGEYGADAFNAKIQGEDQESQAKATTALTEPWQWEHACKLLQVCSRKMSKDWQDRKQQLIHYIFAYCIDIHAPLWWNARNCIFLSYYVECLWFKHVSSGRDSWAKLGAGPPLGPHWICFFP